MVDPNLKYYRELASADPKVLKAIHQKEYARDQGLSAARLYAPSEKIKAYSEAVKTGMTLIDWLKPLFVILLVIVLILGPGMTLLGSLLSFMAWYWWAAAIGIFILAYRQF